MYAMNLRLSMTQEQRDVCDCKDSRIVVEANAGAGKTTLAAMKIARLVALGANPSKIVALSYTEPGVRAYHEAFRRLDIPADVAKSIRVGTFDDFCASRLARFEGVKVDRLVRPEQVRPYVLTAIARARSWVQGKFGDIFGLDGSGELAVEGLLDEFGHIKGTLELPRAPEGFTVSPKWAVELGREFTTLAVFLSYERLRCHSMDADGENIPFRYIGDATYDLAKIMMDADPIFTWETHPLRLGLEAVILDEMHDTNWAMFTVLKSLLDANENAVFLGVGDRDQVIHARNGADACFMGESFDQYLGRPRRLPLTETYRFGRALAQPLGALASKSYQTDEGRMTQVRVRHVLSASDVLKSINEVLTERLGLKSESPNSEIALLLRRPNAAAEIEHELRRLAIPYQAVGYTTYLERPEVLFVRMVLGAAVQLQEEFQARTLTLAKRATWEFIGGGLPIGEDGVDRTESIVQSSTHDAFARHLLPRLLESTTIAEARDQVVMSMDIASSDDIADLPRAIAALNVQSLARRVFVNTEDARNAQASAEGLARAGGSYASISQFLGSLMSHDYDMHAKRRSAGRITFSSIEAAKGLEFEHVILADASRSEFDEHMNDDRNLFYVAASRARNMLTTLHRPGEPSGLIKFFVER